MYFAAESMQVDLYSGKCMHGKNNVGNYIQYHSTDEKIYSLFHCGRQHSVKIPSQAVPDYQVTVNAERDVPSISQQSPFTVFDHSLERAHNRIRIN